MVIGINIYPPTTAFQNQLILYNLTGQIEALANETHVGLEELNAQLWVTLKMALQNRLALDLWLLCKTGICEYFRLTNDTCVHISNITQDLSKELHHMKHVAKASIQLRGSMEVGWYNKFLHGQGFLLMGWLQSLLQSALIIVILIIMFSVLLSCVESMLSQG